jgi:hypothetical protein
LRLDIRPAGLGWIFIDNKMQLGVLDFVVTEAGRLEEKVDVKGLNEPHRSQLGVAFNLHPNHIT